MKRIFVHIAFLLSCAVGASQTLVTDNSTYSPTELVEEILLGSCVEISNVSYTGNPQSIGYFNNGGSIGIQEGILLTTGNTNVAIGPNNATDATFVANRPGYGILETVTGVTNSQDACVLEFDFIPYNNVITFTYSFASEEYPEYVCSQFNDVFAFMVSGPGYAANTNIALIPATATPVAINTVNGGVAGGSPPFTSCPPGGLTHTAYYVDNTGGVFVQYDGYTVPLTATINVTPCQTYHIRLAIADVGDQYLDSGVFIEAQSFTGGENIDVTSSPDPYEGCNGFFTFTRRDATPFPEVVNFTVAGTASEGNDYNNIPSSITIPANQNSVTLNIQTILDALNESSESIIITLQGVCACSGSNKDTLLILNNTTLNATITPDQVRCQGQSGSTALSVTPSGGVSPYTYQWSSGQSTSSISVSPNSTTTYTVTITDATGCQTITRYVNVSVVQATDASFTVSSPQCFNDQDFDFVNTSSYTGSPTFTWRFGDGTTSNSMNASNKQYSSPGTYTVKLVVDNGMCPDSTTKTVTVLPVPTASISPPNASVCSGSSVTLTASGSGGNSPYDYDWSTGPSTASITVSPTSNTTYFVTVTM